MLKINFFVKTGRDVVMARCKYENESADVTTILRVPPGMKFTPPDMWDGGSSRDKKTMTQQLKLTEMGILTRWDALEDKDVKSLLKSSAPYEHDSVAPKVINVQNSLSNFATKRTEQLNKNIIKNARTQADFADNTKIHALYSMGVILEFVEKHGDFDFDKYNSEAAKRIGISVIIDKYIELGNNYRTFLFERASKKANDATGMALSSVSLLMSDLKALIKKSCFKNGINLNDQLLDGIKSQMPKKTNDEDVIAFDIAQYEWIINNQTLIRQNVTHLKQIWYADYMLVGMIIGARKCDLDNFTIANLKTESDGSTSLRYTPQKTKGSSGSVVEFSNVPANVLEVFYRNAEQRNGKLLPVMSSGANGSMRTILKRYDLFKGLIRVRDTKGNDILKPFHDAFKVHSLRSSMITYCLSKGMSETIVKRLSGHSANSSSFHKYIRLSQAVKSDAIKSVFGWVDAA